ncbi:MAG: efflux RND transporter periplasmic adaptor subunit [Rhodocyclales bacterium]|nr:efflux RND transporter periplasmic adaptor subunit [Rhodocyclales bacterium]
MKRLPLSRSAFALLTVLALLLAAFVYVGVRTGPLAPVPVTVIRVESRAIAPALYGVGTVEARHTYRIGPTVAGRLKRLDVDVGERVQVGQVIGEMDPVDLDERLRAQQAAIDRAAASVLAAVAQVEEATAHRAHAQAQLRRYQQLQQVRFVSPEALDVKVREVSVADAGVSAARANRDALTAEHARLQADLDGLLRQRASLDLVAPVDGLVAARLADPGTTLVAGQAAVELVDPASLWINLRVDQARAQGLQAGLAARIVMRSRPDTVLSGTLVRVEPMADAVTEELRARVVFDVMPEALPPIGELAEVSVMLPPLPSRPSVPNASLQRHDGVLGVWIVEDDGLRFRSVEPGAADLDGRVQILDGLKDGDQVVVYSQHALGARSRVRVVDSLPGVTS